MNTEAATADTCCASCGTAAVGDVTLKNCACGLVKYCSVGCQKNDRPNHKKACKKRLAELHDKQLFEQPDSSHLGECPLCCLPLPLRPGKSTMMPCCCKLICNGCSYANKMREFEGGLEHRCAFCREPEEKSEEESDKRIMERVKKNDPVAMIDMGKRHFHEGDYGKAFEYLTNAAELGHVEGHFLLGDLYREGKGVEKDMKKAVYHLEHAAICGHPFSRCDLALHEMENGRPDRAAKHFIIAANLGDEESLQEVKDLFVAGIVSKEDYGAALRAYQAAVLATKSPERENAEKAI
jgi:hypothetical protein